MAEFSEVMQQFDRMCAHYQPTNLCPLNCPMSGYNIIQCRDIMFERPDEFEKIVMHWAAEHPEPVYPTWREWFANRGEYVEADDANINIAACVSILLSRIPADIAEKLGIEPKEG